MLKAGTIVLLVLFFLTGGYSFADIIGPGITLLWLLAGLLIPVKVFFTKKA